MFIGSVPAGTTVSYTLPYTPQFLSLKTTATGDCTSVKATVLGYGNTVDLDNAGLQVCCNPLSKSPFSINQQILPLADGLLNDKTFNISITAGLNAVDVYVHSTCKGQFPIKHVKNTINANTAQDFKKFLVLGSNSFTVADLFSIETNDGMGDNWVLTDAQSQCNLDRAVFGTVISFNNFDQNYRSVKVQASTTRDIYVSALILE
jgi:hypothetical protein